MTISLRMRSNTTAQNTPQEKLRRLVKRSPAARRFELLFGRPLHPFVGQVIEFFESPKAEGMEFEFATGQRESFLNVIDPSTASGKIGPFIFTGGKPNGPLAPDDPGIKHPDRHWRRLAGMASAGISYREPGLKSGLHIVIKKHGADIHLDREGFLTVIDGRVCFDLRETVNHLTADLLSDHVPGLVTSLTVKGKNGQNKLQATFAPWLEVNLPGSTKIMDKRRRSTEGIAGFRVFGIF